MPSTTSHAEAVAPGRTLWQEDIVTSSTARAVLAVSRIAIGFYFLWACIDKVFGFTFTTRPEQALINGGTPAQGYINNVAANGPLGDFFQIFANPFGDYAFLIGLFAIGVALIAGAGLKIAAIAATVLLGLMYLAAPPWYGQHGANPILDAHILDMFLVILPAVTLAGDTWGLGRWWGGKVGNGILR